jgi:hypothetical protein
MVLAAARTCAWDMEIVIGFRKRLILLESLIQDRAAEEKSSSFSILYTLFVRQTGEMA